MRKWMVLIVAPEKKLGQRRRFDTWWMLKMLKIENFERQPTLGTHTRCRCPEEGQGCRQIHFFAFCNFLKSYNCANCQIVWNAKIWNLFLKQMTRWIFINVAKIRGHSFQPRTSKLFLSRLSFRNYPCQLCPHRTSIFRHAGFVTVKCDQ